MAKTNPANPNRPLPRSMVEQDRTEKAREHYRTRAERRRKGQSMSDDTLYVDTPWGRTRRIPRESLILRQALVAKKGKN